MGKDKRAVAVVRVSSHRQSDDASFRENQEKEIKLYCDYHGLNLVEVFHFIESAKDSEKRKKSMEAESWADKNKIRHRVFYMSDREARNMTDIERSEKRILKDEIVIHHALDRKIYWKNTPAADFFMREMQGANNKHFVRMIRTKVNFAQKSKAESGWFPGNKPTLGYMTQALIGSDGRELKRGKIVVPDSDIRKVRQVQREFELRGNEKMTLEQIAEQLAAEGFIGFSEVKGYVSTLDRRLRNKFYGGTFNWPKDGPEYKGNHELIIKPGLFKLVQQTFNKGGLYQKKRGVFSGGWLKCAHQGCGCFVTYDPKKKKTKNGLRVHKYYRCSNGKKVHMRLQNISEGKIFDQLGGALDALQITDEFAKDLTEAINVVKNKMLDRLRAEMNGFKNGLKDLDNEEDVVFKSLSIGQIDQELFDRQIKRIRFKRNEFTDRLESANERITNNGLETVQSTIELAKSAKSLWSGRTDIEKRELLEKLLSNPVLDGVNVRYDLKKPFAKLVEMKEKVKWRSLRESNPCLTRERGVS